MGHKVKNARVPARAAGDSAAPATPGHPPTDVAPAPAENLTKGSLVAGRYRIDSPLGRGGIGAVFLARDEQVAERRVAIKVLLERSSASEWIRDKFDDERRALARLHHPNIVAVTDSGWLSSGQPFLVMEYVPGATLRVRMEQSPLSFAEVAAILVQLGRAVAAAHDSGVIHRDLKPENVIVRDLGSGEWLVKIVDFGVATVQESLAQDAHTTRAAGTRAYMAPEQLRGRPLPASDVYALAAISHELLTGRPPFAAQNDIDLMEAQRRGLLEPPSAGRRDLPSACDELIESGLAFDAERRPASAREFAGALASALPGAARQPGGVSQPRRFGRLASRMGLAALAVAASTAVGYGVWRWSRPHRPVPPVASATTVESALDYAVTVQRYRNGRPYRAPFVLPGPLLFAVDDRIRISVSSRRSGHLYVLDEGPVRTGGLPSFNVLFPSMSTRDGAATIAAGEEIEIPSRSWLVFDDEQGQEKLWLVWSEKPQPSLDQVAALANPTDRGAIRDEQRARAVRDFLAAHQSAGLAVTRDSQRQRTLLRCAGSVLVAPVTLEHR